jgi:archaellum component FlaC
MPARLSDEIRSEILRLYFLEGEQRDGIVSKLDISGGTVSNVVAEFRRAFGVPKDLDVIHKLAVTLRELKMTPEEAKAGAEVRERLRELGADGEGLSRFVSGLYKAAEGRGHGIAEVVEGSIRLLDLEGKTGKGYEEMLKSFEDLSDKRTKLADEVKGLRTETRVAREERDRAIEDKATTAEALIEFCAARDALREVKKDIADYASLGRMIANAKELDLDPARIAEEIAVVDDLGTRRSKLEKSITDLEERKRKAEEALGQLTQEISDKGPLLEKLQEVEALGLGVDDLGALRKTVVKIGSRHGLDPREALGKLFADLQGQYDDELGFENQLVRTKAQIETATNQLDTWGAKLENLRNSYSAEKSVVDAMRALMKAGVDGQRILDWNSFIEKLGTNIEAFGKDLQGYADVRELIATMEEEAKALEARVKDLKAGIATLEGQKSEIENSIAALRDAGVNEIKRIRSAAVMGLKELQREAEGSIGVISRAAVDEVKRSASVVIENVKETGTKVAEAASQGLQEAKAVTDGVKVSIDGLYTKALQAGEILGEFKYIEPMHKLLISGEGNPMEVYTTMRVLLAALMVWLGSNPTKVESLLPNLVSLDASIGKEMNGLTGEKATA